MCVDKRDKGKREKYQETEGVMLKINIMLIIKSKPNVSDKKQIQTYNLVVSFEIHSKLAGEKIYFPL